GGGRDPPPDPAHRGASGRGGAPDPGGQLRRFLRGPGRGARPHVRRRMNMAPLRIPAVYMRGGTSKGVFFRAADLPADPARRERILLRALGSPDPYGRQIDGLGGATSSTSKVVIAAPATRADCDVEFRFGQVAIERAVIDWSGNCGNLTAAVGPFALAQGWVRDAPADGVARVRIWQQNIGKLIVGHVPVRAGAVVED